MTYSEARTVEIGDVLRTDWGDGGEVVAVLDTGLSMIFTLWRQDHATVRVHSSHAWRSISLGSRVEAA